MDSQACSAPFELVLVLDGCTDNTAELVQSLRVERSLKLVELPGLGPAAARNRGVDAAMGDLLVFMDDDEVPQPGMLEAHIAAHAEAARLAVVGPYPYSPEIPVNPVDFFIREWWHSRFKAMMEPGHEYTYRDCLTGNLSISRRDFELVGGLDEEFPKAGREDYELGIRLLKSGVRIKCAPEALAYHYPISRPKSLLSKQYTCGYSDILLARKHPEVFETLPIQQYWRRSGYKRKWARTIALSTRVMRTGLFGLLGALFERNSDRLWDERFLGLWRRSLHFAYLLGATSAVGGIRELEAFLTGWADPAEWPRCSVRIEDVDILSEPREIGGVDRCDRLLLVPRIGKSVAGWVELPCRPSQDCVPAAEIARRVCEQVSWPVWRSLVTSDEEDVPSDEADEEAWRKFRTLVQSLSNPAEAPLPQTVAPSTRDSSHISAVIFSEDNGDGLSRTRPAFERDGIVSVVTVGDGGLAAALSACPTELVALLKPSDRVDSGWAEAASRHFLDPQTACVVAPVILPEVRTRGQELYQVLVNFERVRSWRHYCLTDSCHPACVLSGFSAACHRLVLNKRALESLCGSLVESGRNCEGTSSRLLYALLHAYERIIYEPRALIWNDLPMSTAAVKGMAVEHTNGIYKAVFDKLLSGRTGRLRALLVLAELARANARKLLGCACGRSQWPLSFAVAEALAAARNLLGGWHRER